MEETASSFQRWYSWVCSGDESHKTFILIITQSEEKSKIDSSVPVFLKDLYWDFTGSCDPNVNITNSYTFRNKMAF